MGNRVMILSGDDFGRLVVARLGAAVRAIALAVVAGSALVVLHAGVAAAADPVYGTPTATATYGKSVDFTQPVSIPGAVKRAEILLDFPGGAGPLAAEVPGTQPGDVTLRHQLLIADSHLLPNTTITARWRLTATDGSATIGPAVTVHYQDTRFQWKTQAGALVRVHWYSGSDAFGALALQIGERAVGDTSKLLGVAETQPIDFFVYADQSAFYDALGPATRENVGGQANAEIRTLFALITPAEINADWVRIVIPHELTHLVFNTAVDNPYHFPPRWLNEGLAVFRSEGYGQGNRQRVATAAADGSLMPLGGLSGQFPTALERFSLAYAESVSSVDYLVNKYGRDSLVALIKSYATGLTDDEAFRKALGVDVAGFDAAWRADLHAREPVVHGPQPAPPGPLPAGWTDANASPAPSGAPAVPRASGSGSSAAPASGSDSRAGANGGSPTTVIAGVGLALLVAVAAFLVLQRRRRRGDGAP